MSPRPVVLLCTLVLLTHSGCRQPPEQAATGAVSAPSAVHTHGAGAQEGVHLSAMAKTSLDLQVVEATTQTIEQIVTIPGLVKVQPDRRAVVTPRVVARIDKVYVQVGDIVRHGVPLLDLRSTEVEKLQVELLRATKSRSILEQSYARAHELLTKTVLTELEQMQQELIKTHGSLQLVTAAVERVQQLADKVVPRKELLAAQTEQQHARSAYDAARRKLHTYGVTEAQMRTMLNGGLTQPVLSNLGLTPEAATQKYLVLGKPGELFALEAEVRQKQADVDSLQRQLHLLGVSPARVTALLQRGVPEPLLTLTAPISGAISVRQATLGAMVEATETLFEIIDTSVLWVEGEITEQLFPVVRAGQRARIRVAAYPDTVFTGTVHSLGRTVDPEKRTVHLWIAVTNAEGRLLPEMFTDVSLVTQTVTAALAVPVQAILSEGAERFVFVENGEVYVPQPLVLGLRDDRYAEVRDGLFPGDRVVVRGGYELQAARLAVQSPGGGDGHGHTH